MVGAGGEFAEAGIDAFGEGDFHGEDAVLEGEFGIGAGVAEAGGCGGGGGGEGSGEEDGAALQAADGGDGAVGVGDFGEGLAGEVGVERFGGLWFWKSDDGEVKLCGE